MASTLEYTPLPERAAKAIEGFLPDHDRVQKRVEHFAHVEPRSPDKDGDKEIIDGVEFTHHFVMSPGDYEVIEWHYVTCGKPEGIPIVFLHGIPDSWYQWHPQMVGMSSTHHCVSVDLKGYGQSSKAAGSFVHETVAEQLYTMLLQISIKKFFLITHDRGTVQGDFICAKHPEAVLGYARGEQHLYHLNEALYPQQDIFMNAPYSNVMVDRKHFVLFVYTWITQLPIPDDVVARAIQEFSYADIDRAVPRYFSSSSFRQEWLARRQGGWTKADGTKSESGLLEAWKCPVVIMQGYDSKTQPREFYEKARVYIPNAKAVEVRYMQGGHFWTLESPEETTQAVRRLIELVGAQ
ncbi:hypothetical protein LTR17_010998 [Elasticomyces elasticus]|nr:hypothetical protein LTR17_010998 [Elasticomyces elasticus]